MEGKVIIMRNVKLLVFVWLDIWIGRDLLRKSAYLLFSYCIHLLTYLLFILLLLQQHAKATGINANM